MYDATIWCKFDLQQCSRARGVLSDRWWPFLNQLSEFRVKLKIQTITLKMFWNVWKMDKINLYIKFITKYATIGCKFDVHQCCRAQKGLS